MQPDHRMIAGAAQNRKQISHPGRRAMVLPIPRKPE
jgi:hypothetical protein